MGSVEVEQLTLHKAQTESIEVRKEVRTDGVDFQRSHGLLWV